MSVAVLVPALNRPKNVKPLVESLAAATSVLYRLVFICDPDDKREIGAIEAAKELVTLRLILTKGNYAGKVNAGVEATDEPLVFTGADDLRFQPGWFEAAKARIDAGAHVVGVNDLLDRRREHATHFLMTREYAEQPTLDGRPGPLATAYAHNFVDDELIATAKKRGVYAYAEDSHVRHLHPMNGLAEMDETYKRGYSTMHPDRRRFLKRQSLWM